MTICGKYNQQYSRLTGVKDIVFLSGDLASETFLIDFALAQTQNATGSDLTTASAPAEKPGFDWIVFGVVLFSVLVFVSLAVSLPIGIYKFRRYHYKHGMYKSKSKVEQEIGERTHDMSMFTVQSEHTPFTDRLENETENQNFADLSMAASGY
ncbi:hypothetical protein DPMN_114829 [Dreissena polymorpha]|uniref:Uncharacterized protein n=1 Tax=Dreissena polymorpha TaxID=45954 RepID=A0A9D4KK49_DREPO|nr:hypothetical protein DPMN_114829 [Dreissena polymorpha]